MYEDTIPEQLHAKARRLAEHEHELDELSQLYAQSDEEVAKGGDPSTGARTKRAANWATALRRYEDFWTERGHSPREHTRNRATLPDEERRMGEWARYQRRFEENLCRYQIIRLDVSPAFKWDPHDHVWQENLNACIHHFRSTGRLPYLNGSDLLEFALARWLGRQLRQLQMGTLEQCRDVRLTALLDMRGDERADAITDRIS
jgi:hypothetical protein